jgi:hypothetical protein
MLLLIATPGRYQQVSSPAAEAARLDDVYSIYSLLMTDPPSAIRGINEPTLMIAGKTAGPRSLSDLQECVVLPAEYQSRWNELLTDFNRNGSVETIESRLKISKRYLVLTPEEVADFTFNWDRLPEYQKPLNPKFEGARHLFYLGKVYFNRDRTLAVTSISAACGSLCGRGGWRVFEKKGMVWELMTRRAGTTACGDSVA